MKTNEQIIYGEDAVFDFDTERDKDLFEHYSPISLLLSCLPTAGSVELKCGEHYKLTISKITDQVGNKMNEVLNHPDGVSGTTIFECGMKAYWTEGRSSYVIYEYPKPPGVTPGWVNLVESIPMWEQHPLNEQLDAIHNSGNFTSRPMTPEEVSEWEVARGH